MSTLPNNYRMIDSRVIPKGIRTSIIKQAIKLLGIVKPKQDIAFAQNPKFPAFLNNHRYGVHFGVMIPDLPAPHYFMACCSMHRPLGIKAFDVDSVVGKNGPRNTAIFTHGTAMTMGEYFKAYDMNELSADKLSKTDGSIIKFADDTEITGQYPNFRLKTQRADFNVDLELTATGEKTWYAYAPIYKHMGLTAKYNGSITYQGETLNVSGLGTFEYAFATTPNLLFNKITPRKLKMPWDVFSYHVIQLDDGTILTMAYVEILRYPALAGVYIRKIGATDDLKGLRFDGEVTFKVTSLQTTPAFAPDGRETWLPKTFVWTATHRDGRSMLEIQATTDTPFLFGIGQGYVGGYSWHGTYEGKPIQAARGYCEYVDQRYD